MNIHVVLLAPEIPHNTGAIGRLCVNLDCPLHLIEPLGFSLDESQVRRVGLDYWRHVELAVHEDWDAFIAQVHPHRIFFLSTRGRQTYLDCRFEDGDALVFGNETSGLPGSFYATYADQLVTIPMPGPQARSHNLSNAAAIVLYEAYRQLEHK